MAKIFAPGNGMVPTLATSFVQSDASTENAENGCFKNKLLQEAVDSCNYEQVQLQLRAGRPRRVPASWIE